MGRAIVLALFGVLAGINQMPAMASTTPEKTVASVDFCADQYVLALAPPAAILALSPDAKSAYSSARSKAANLPIRNPRAEMVLSLKPDLVVRQWGGDARMGQMLSAHAIEMVQLGYATDFAGIYANIRQVGNALGTDTKAEALIATIKARKAALTEAAMSSVPAPSALYVTPGGVTAGRGTLIDAVLTAAGLTNRAAADGASGWVPLPAEALVLDPPDLIVTGFFDGPLNKANAWSPARHPVFKKLFAQIPTITLPVDQISCASPAAFDAVATIREAVMALPAQNAHRAKPKKPTAPEIQP
ncbi:MAG: ABC transporter substrate-binding protein [Pseudomonadota bacterium]